MANAIINAALTVENAFTPRQESAPGAQDVRITEPEVPTHHVPAEPAEPRPGALPAQAEPAGPRAAAGTPDARARVPRSGRGVVTAGGTTPLEDVLAGELAGVRDDIRAFLAAHPGVAVEISWRPVGADGADGWTQSGSPSGLTDPAGSTDGTGEAR
jgi:hypothetical protein